jgi:3-deoxy-D-manno-octulosonate 8-phosphate phosphatase (KDO 8-P phosphatase)
MKRKLRALFFDVDGCLTDGRLYIDDRGRETKVFDTKDGHGLRKALAAGLEVAWVSGRTSLATAVRARDLGVRHCFQGDAGVSRLPRPPSSATTSRTCR